MRTLFLMTALGFGLAPVKEIATEYKPGVARRVTIESAVHMELKSMEVERDGETQTSSATSSTDTERTEVHVDQVIEAEDGKPTKVRRRFAEISGKSARESSENASESALESPWGGVTLELTSDGDAVEAKVVAGTEPSGEGALDGHAIGLLLDGFLPGKSVEDGGEWEIDSAAIVRGLRLDLQGKLFPPAPRGEGREGGRRGGRGGGESFLAQSEWKGTGKLAGTEDKDGVTCLVIELEFETSGDQEIERGPGRGGRALTVSLENRRSWSAQLEGKLYFDPAAKRPVLLELKGSLEQEDRSEMERGGSTLKMHSVREGSIEYTVEIEDAQAEEPKQD